MLSHVGAVAYKLDLPASSRIHNMLHVSQLKKQVPPKVTSEPDVSMVAPKSLCLLRPDAVVQTQLFQRGGKLKPRLKVRWTGRSADHDSWEEAFVLHQQLPTHSAWGQAAPQGVGNVMWWANPGRRPKSSRCSRQLDRAWRAQQAQLTTTSDREGDK